MMWRRQRGSVLVLVAAVLALLAVLATVYITISRTEAQSARMTASAMNMDLARDAAMAQVRTLLFNATTDSQGVIGGLTAQRGNLPGQTSRFYDYPETGAAFGQTDANGAVPDQPWLARSAYPATGNDFSMLAQFGWNPATGDTSIPIQGATLNTVGDPDHPQPDAPAYLVSYSAGSGERYRFGVRIVDLSCMANLNTGAPQQFADPQGRYLSSYFLGNVPALAQSRQGSYTTPFSLTDWQTQILSIEQTPATQIALFDTSDELALRAYGAHGTAYFSRPAYALAGLAPGGAARGDYTTYSFSRDLRLRPDPPLPLPAPTTSPATAPATAPAGPPSPPYTLTPTDGKPYPTDCGMYVWPLMPEKVWINPTLDTANATLDAMFYHARAATNIATAMEQAGFSSDEARAFAANYLSFRWNGMVVDPQSSAGGYYVPAGPSFVDDQGVCVRVADGSGNVTTRDFGSSSDLCTILPGEDISKHASHAFVGFLPQPFINKVAAVMRVDQTTGVLAVSDVAVEFYNPFPVALSLNGFKLKAAGTPIDLTALSIPARGFLVVVQQAGGTLAGKVAAGTTVSGNGALALDPSGGMVTLTRPYIPRGKGTADPRSDAVVDAYAYDNLVATPGVSTGASAIYFLRRSNDAGNTNQPHWQAAIQVAGSTTRYADGQTGTLALGAANPDDQVSAVPLYDRFAWNIGAHGTPLIQQGDPFANFGEFNRIMRIGNQCATPGWGGGSGPAFIDNPISAQIGNLTGSSATTQPATAATDFPFEAEVRFDFKASPFFYAGGVTPASCPYKAGDPRAVRLLDYLAMVDRVPDRSIDVGSGPVSIDKMRIAGRINVNTASRNVLLGLPNMTAAMAGAIVAYRDRTGAFADQSVYPGKGIRTLAELLVPITVSANTSSATLEQRDKAWASVINLCTTRSDAFVVYGYLEAIRANPLVAHNNAGDWYDTGSTSDDPHSATAKNIRISRLRWVAIVDRSWCNYGRGATQFTLPRAVAIENLAP